MIDEEYKNYITDIYRKTQDVHDKLLIAKLEKDSPNLKMRLDNVKRDLEKVLVQIDLESMPKDESVMDERINFDALYELAKRYDEEIMIAKKHNGGIIKRIRKAFQREKDIQIYRNLLEDVKNTARTSQIGLKYVDGIRVPPSRFKGLGAMSWKIIYTHLNNKGIDFFSNGYRDAEIYKE